MARIGARLRAVFRLTNTRETRPDRCNVWRASDVRTTGMLIACVHWSKCLVSLASRCTGRYLSPHSDTVRHPSFLAGSALIQNRRCFLKSTAGAMLVSAGGSWLVRADAQSALGPAELSDGTLGTSSLESLPGKFALIKKTWRPPNFETPVSYFDQAFTPNQAFFVRYHLAAIPEVAQAQWSLQIAGEGAEKPLVLDYDSLRRDFESVPVNALCLCSGNRRGLSDPHVPGIQWGHGAIGIYPDPIKQSR